jgi:glyoxylase-like metal-dependent hydrolase (beta-lactamase superfamily II)
VKVGYGLKVSCQHTPLLAEVWEPVEGVEVVELGDGVEKPVKCYLLKSDRGYILVDTGYPGTVEKLLPILSKYRISRIVLTHLHIDHAGGAAAVRKYVNAPLAYHVNEALTLEQALKAGDWIKHLGLDVERGVEIVKAYAKHVPRPDIYAVDGDEMSGWRILHTPGHTPGHVVLVGGEAAVTGDLILHDDTSNVAYVPLHGYRPLTNYLESLVKVAGLQVKYLLPAHGLMFREWRTRVGEIFNHHYQRLEETAKALMMGYGHLVEVARRIRWSKGSFDTLQVFDRWLALLETVSHLEFLREAEYAAQQTNFTYKPSDNPDWEKVKQKLNTIAAGIWRA